jgi:hypothetical protein
MAREGLTLSGARRMAERGAAAGEGAGTPVPPLDAARKATR